MPTIDHIRICKLDDAAVGRFSDQQQAVRKLTTISTQAPALARPHRNHATTNPKNDQVGMPDRRTIEVNGIGFDAVLVQRFLPASFAHPCNCPLSQPLAVA
ncbi:hypothetical protein EEB14_51045 [Rhodococcus sp. WS4]|nr:hypothetical protein EEB14_51045 [Rhodococcus sp. WS4]